MWLHLPIVAQVIVWVLFLPITVGLWIWESDLALWARVPLVIVLGIGWTAVMYPRSKERSEQAPSEKPGWHEVTPGSTVAKG